MSAAPNAIKSEPPPSHPRPRVEPEKQRPSAMPDPEWRPAVDDSSLKATDYRARTALRRADRALDAIGSLNENVVKLDATITSFRRALLWVAGTVGVPLLLAAIKWIAATAWTAVAR